MPITFTPNNYGIEIGSKNDTFSGASITDVFKQAFGTERLKALTLDAQHDELNLHKYTQPIAVVGANGEVSGEKSQPYERKSIGSLSIS